MDDIAYYHFEVGTVAGCTATISRTGYTGEDGFELYVEEADTVAVWNALFEQGGGAGLLPSGLGARDSLRLEVGFALYGNELDEEHTPWAGRLGWLVKLDKGEFSGRDALLRQKEEGVPRKARRDPTYGSGAFRAPDTQLSMIGTRSDP